MSYIRFQPTVRLRVALLLCMQRLRSDLYGDNSVAVESVGTTPAGGTLEGKLAFQIITSDDLWRYTLEFLGPEKEANSSADSVAHAPQRGIWSVKAHPSKLVDIFWHCHMLRRKFFVKRREVIGSSAFTRASPLIYS